METKKFLSLLLTLAMVLSLVPVFSVSAFAEGNELSKIVSNTVSVTLDKDNMSSAQAISIAAVQKPYTLLSSQTAIAYAESADFASNNKYKIITASSSANWTSGTEMTLAEMQADSTMDYFVIGTVTNHIHDWIYTLSKTKTDNDTINASCAGIGACDYKADDKKLTISASDAVYDGKSHGATLDCTSIAGRTVAEMPSLKYEKKTGENSWSAIGAIPTTAGIYRASFTIGSDNKATTASVEFTIAKKTLVITNTTANSKAYDGTADATISLGTTSGAIVGDDVAVTVSSAAFEDKNVGSDKSVSITYKLIGADAENYTISNSTASAVISPKKLSVSGAAVSDKIYDGTTTAAVTAGELTGVASGDDVSLVVSSAAFEDAAVGKNKRVTIVYALTGAAIDNYEAPDDSVISANISAFVPVVYDDPITIPVSGGKSCIKLQVSISGNVASIGNITTDEINKLADCSNVVMDLTSLPKSVDSIVIPKTTFENIVNSDAGGLEIKMPNGVTAIFDCETLLAVADQAEGMFIKLVICRDSKAESSMTESQKETVSEMNNAAVIDAYFVSNGKRISDFKGGKAELVAEYATARPVRVWYVADNGDKSRVDNTFDGKKASFTVFHFSHYVIETDPELAFYDVASGSALYDAVIWAAEKGITEGNGGYFKPGRTTTRANMVSFLWRAAGCPEPTITECPFTDVKAGSYYEKAVLWGYETGIVLGITETTFCPSRTVNRGQALTFIWRYCGAMSFANMTASGPAPSPFADVKNTSFCYNAMLWARAEELISKDATKMYPKAGCTRGEVISYLYKALVK